MTEQQYFEGMFEIPTKFNKYRRLQERADRESASHNDRTSKLGHSYLPTTHEWTDIYHEDKPLNLTVQRKVSLTDSPSKTTDAFSGRRSKESSPLRLDVNHNNYQDKSSSFVDEHFQRSLGREYPVLQNQISPLRTGESSPTTVQRDVNVYKHKVHSENGSVDDHFSKSLGEIWTKVKSSATTANTNSDSDVHQHSVDDHFAKALGETWFKIQSDSDRGRGRVESTNKYYRNCNTPQTVSQISYSR